MPVAGLTVGPNLAGPNPFHTGIDGVRVWVRSMYLAPLQRMIVDLPEAGRLGRRRARGAVRPSARTGAATHQSRRRQGDDEE